MWSGKFSISRRNLRHPDKRTPDKKVLAAIKIGRGKSKIYGKKEQNFSRQ